MEHVPSTRLVEAMDLSIQDLGSIGELIAAIATIATLFYLAQQLRMNTRIVRATASANTQDSLAVINELVASDPKLAKLFAKLLDGATQDQFEPGDFEQITCALRANMQRFELAAMLVAHAICPNYLPGPLRAPADPLGNAKIRRG